jgi:CTP:molybdopterin cytidylyltransferase MocA
VLIVNPSPDEGQLSSLQLGLRAAAVFDPNSEAALVLPVDVPLVSAATVRALAERWRESRAPVVRPVSRDGRHGHPVIFSAALFGILLCADPSVGAKAIVHAHVSAVGDVLTDDEGAFLDIDTVEDYTRAFGRPPDRIG